MRLQLRLVLSYVLLTGLFLVVLALGAGLVSSRPVALSRVVASWEFATRLVDRADEARAAGGWEGAARALELAVLPPGSTLAVVPPSGPPLLVQGAEVPEDPEALREARRGRPVARVASDPRPDRRLVALWLPVRDSGGVLALRVPTGLPREVRGALFQAMLVPVLVASGVTLAAGLWLASAISGPVRRLAQASEDLGSGDLSRRARVGGMPELADLARSFNRMAERLEQQDRSRRDLLADVSHTLRTPLTAIQGWTEALADGLARGEEERLLDLIHRETRFLSRTVGRLLDLSRWEAGEARLDLREVDLGEPVMEAVEAVSGAAEARGTTLSLVGPLAGTRVRADRERLRELVQILLENAVEHAGSGVHVTVAVSPAGERVQVQVSDDGQGIPEEARPDLFRRFGGRGTGLGLAIAERIVRSHRGSLEVGEGPGAVFRFTLPGAGVPRHPEVAEVDAVPGDGPVGDQAEAQAHHPPAEG